MRLSPRLLSSFPALVTRPGKVRSSNLELTSLQADIFSPSFNVYLPCTAQLKLSLPYPALPHPAVPHPTLPYLTLPYLTLPCPALCHPCALPQAPATVETVTRAELPLSSTVKQVSTRPARWRSPPR